MFRIIIATLIICAVYSTCDASTAPTNGAVGTCTSTLANSSSCVPVCNTGYTLTGTTTCGTGTLSSSATCTGK